MLPIDVVHSDFGFQTACTRMPMCTWSIGHSPSTCIRMVSAPSSSTCTGAYGRSSLMFSDGTRLIENVTIVPLSESSTGSGDISAPCCGHEPRVGK
jgi:hypothetical protein